MPKALQLAQVRRKSCRHALKELWWFILLGPAIIIMSETPWFSRRKISHSQKKKLISLLPLVILIWSSHHRYKAGDHLENFLCLYMTARKRWGEEEDLQSPSHESAFHLPSRMRLKEYNKRKCKHFLSTGEVAPCLVVQDAVIFPYCSKEIRA